MIRTHLNYVGIHFFDCVQTFSFLSLNVFQDLFATLWNLPQKSLVFQLLLILLLAKMVGLYATLLIIWWFQFLIRYFVELAFDGWILRESHIFIAWDLTYANFMRLFSLLILVDRQSFTYELFILISWTILWYLIGLKVIINAIKKRLGWLFLNILRVDIGHSGLMIVGGFKVESLELGGSEIMGTDRVVRVEVMMVGWRNRSGFGHMRVFEQDGLDSFQIVIDWVDCGNDRRVL